MYVFVVVIVDTTARKWWELNRFQTTKKGPINVHVELQFLLRILKSDWEQKKIQLYYSLLLPFSMGTNRYKEGIERERKKNVDK